MFATFSLHNKVLENIAWGTAKWKSQWKNFNLAFLTMKSTFFPQKTYISYENIAGHFEKVGWNQEKHYGGFHLFTQTCALGPEVFKTVWQTWGSKLLTIALKSIMKQPRLIRNALDSSKWDCFRCDFLMPHLLIQFPVLKKRFMTEIS